VYTVRESIPMRKWNLQGGLVHYTDAAAGGIK